MARNKLISSPERITVVPLSPPNEELNLFASAKMNGGMISVLDQDPEDIQDGELQLALNCRIRDGVTSRRSGLVRIEPSKPDSLPVISFNESEDFENVVRLLRFTTESVYLYGSSWTEIEPDTGVDPIDFGVNDFIQFLTTYSPTVFSNGLIPLQVIDFDTNTYAPLGNSRSYKYYTTIANRIVGANLYDETSPNPVEIGWCGDGNFEEWDPLVDISAGRNPLVSSPSDAQDDISGLFGFGESLLVMREKSIWLGALQPSATDPFYFYNVVPTMGCDTPKSIQKIPSGVCYYDRRLSNVFEYTIGQQEPKEISDLKVRKAIKATITDPNLVFSGYDSTNDEYILAVPLSSTSTVRIWRYNRVMKAWSYDEVSNVTSLSNLNYNRASVSIDDLVGSIDDLLGDINDLSSEAEQVSYFIGRSDGELLIEDQLSDTDDSVAFFMDSRSKLYQMPVTDTNVAQLHIEYTPYRVGAFTIQYSKDGGTNFRDYKTITIPLSGLNKRLIAVCNKHIRCTTYMWRVSCSAGLFDLLGFKVYNFPVAGYTRQKTS